MKNFVRLVQFAWHYQSGLDCRSGAFTMVAFLFFTELGAVYTTVHAYSDGAEPQALGGGGDARPLKAIHFTETRALEADTAFQFAESKQRDFEVLRNAR